MKFKLSNPLNTSSVNLVQYRMSLLVPLNPIETMKNDVHNPTQVYIGKNSNPRMLQNRYKPDRNASDNPVGAMNVIGCPDKIEYAIPAPPLPIKNSATPS
eukprot:816517_1